MIRILFVKLGSNPETKPIVKKLRAELGDCFFAGVEETLEVCDSAYDEVLTSHDDALFGAFSKFRMESLAVSPQLYEEVRSFEGLGLRMIERLKYYPQESYRMPDHTPKFVDSFQARSDLFFRYCAFWDHILSVYEFDAVISQNLAHMAWDFPLERLCEKRRIPYLIFSEVGQWPRIQYIQESVQSLGNLSLGLELKRLARHRLRSETPGRVTQHLDRLRTIRPVDDPLFNRLMPREGSEFRTGALMAILNRGDVRREIDSIGATLRAILDKCRRLSSSPRRTLRGFLRTVRRAALTRRVRADELRVVQEIDPNVPFVFFPLHFQPEASTGAKGRHFVEQREAIAFVAKSLPPEWRLVVKEHPHQYRRLYDRKNFYWRRISSIPKVIVVRHDLDPRKITAESEGIVSISHSSIATEAWASGKRVVFLGDSHLREAPGVSVVETLEELRQVWLSLPPSVSDDEIIKYLKQVEDSTVEGTLYGSAWYLSESEQTDINQRTQHNVTEIILAWLSTKGLYRYP